MHGVMQKRLTVYSIAAFFSILFSVWAALKTVVINPDAICYLYSAEAIDKGLAVASHLCEQAKWPFYSILIFGVSKLTHFSSTISAYILDGFFSLLTVMSFIAIVSLCTDRIRIIALSALVILCAHEFNSLRVEIVRDHGFWAFYLLSLFFGLRYFIKAKTYDAFFWSASIIIATLFRIEGILFLVLFPFALFLDKQKTFFQKTIHFLQLNLLTLIGAAALFIWIMIHPNQSLGRLSEIQFQIQHGLTEFIQSFQHTTNALNEYVLNHYSARDAVWIAIGMLGVWYILMVLSNLSHVYAIFVIYAWCQKVVKWPGKMRLAVWSYILINILITTVFLVDQMFLSARYLMALSLVLMLWVPFAMDNLIAQKKHKWLLFLAGILVMVYGLGGIFDLGHSKKYIRAGGDWLALHASAQQKIYSNDYQLLYYSQHIGDAIFSVGRKYENLNTINNKKWQRYDYVALRVSKQELQNNALLREFKFQPVAIFQNDRGDQVRIYDIHQWRMKQ